MPDLPNASTAPHEAKARRWPGAVLATLGLSIVVSTGLGGTGSTPPSTQAAPSEGSGSLTHIPIGNMECTACHNPASMDTVTWTFTLQLPGGIAERTAPVPHDKHDQLGCTTCHGRPPNPVQEDFSCASTCHAAHLRAPDIDCRVCHEPPPRWAHAYGVVHQGCTGGICHSLPVEDSLPWRRPLCMVCHQDLDVYIPEVDPATGAPVRREPPPASDTTTGVGAQGPQFSVQLGAFSEMERARALYRRALDAGLEARLIVAGGAQLLHVRVGLFESADSAEELLRRVEEMGFVAALVRDARTEEPIGR